MISFEDICFEIFQTLTLSMIWKNGQNVISFEIFSLILRVIGLQLVENIVIIKRLFLSDKKPNELW